MELGPRIHINPPPEDRRCDCCGRHISELKPFGKVGDPLVVDFHGELLVKRWRHEFPYDEEAKKVYDEFIGHRPTEDEYKKRKKMMIEKFGEEEALNIELRVSAHSQVGSSRECRDCIVLDEDEYFEKRSQRWAAERQSRCRI